MDDARLVRGFERLGDLPGDGERLLERQAGSGGPRAADQRVERVALDQLHGERARGGGVFEAEDLRDVRVVEGREDPRLALEAREPIRVLRKRLGQNLQRDIASKFRVAGAIDFAHAAGAKRREDLVRAEPSAGLEGQR